MGERIQVLLYNLGLYSGKIDGIAGRKTVEAIKLFQKANPPLKVDGYAGDKTMGVLIHKQPAGKGVIYTPLQKDVSDFYGEMGKNQTTLKIPYPMVLSWDKDTTIDKFSCHKAIAEPLGLIFEQTLDTYGYDNVCALGLNVFGGCLNIRRMRGGNDYSMHSWGIAVDLDPENNKLKWDHTRARFAKKEYQDFWDIVYKNGATSLGKEKDYDYMHFQFARV